MLNGQLSVQLSTLPSHCGWHPFSQISFQNISAFFLGESGCSTLWLLFLNIVYTLEASVEKSLLMVRASFSLLYLFSQVARATRRCFAVSRAVVTEVSLSFPGHSCFLVAVPLDISLILLTSDLNLLIFLSGCCCQALWGVWGPYPFFSHFPVVS